MLKGNADAPPRPEVLGSMFLRFYSHGLYGMCWWCLVGKNLEFTAVAFIGAKTSIEIKKNRNENVLYCSKLNYLEILF